MGSSSQIITKRLHVSGLTPSITPTHIKDRFNSFGVVREVEELQPDALGQARPFTFFTIETTPQQLQKCLNIMSGSTWRGTQLRLAEAKPKYEARVEAERNPSPKTIELKLRQKRRRLNRSRAEDVGKQAQDMRIVNEKNYTVKPHWTLSSTNHLIRPICLRPAHPIPPASIQPSKLAKDPRTKRSADRRPRPAISRAPRKVIDPTRWNPVHLSEASFMDYQSESSDPGVQDGWEYEELHDENAEIGLETEEDIRVIGIWRRVVDGEVVDEQVVRAKKRLLDDVDTEDDPLVNFEMVDHDSPLFAGLNLAGEDVARERESSPLISSRDGESSKSPLPNMNELDEDDEVVSNSTGNDNDDLDKSLLDQSSSPLFPIRQLPPTPAQSHHSPPPVSAANVPPTSIKIIQNPNIPVPLINQAREERSKGLSVLNSLLGGDQEIDGERLKKNEWAGFTEDSDDDDEYQVLRLRGGAGDVEIDEDSESGNEDDDPSSEIDSEASSENDDNAVPKSDNPFKPNTLKDMFAPRADDAPKFSLLQNLDIEIDETLDIPLPIPDSVNPQNLEEIEILPIQPTHQDLFDASSSNPLFFPVGPSVPKSSSGNMAVSRNALIDDYSGTSPVDLVEEEVPLWNGGRGDNGWMRSGLGLGVGGPKDGKGLTPFWRVESDETMKEVWERERVGLTREYKRRFREAVKQRRRRGGGGEDD